MAVVMRVLQAVVSFVYYLWTGQFSFGFTYIMTGIFGNFAVFVLPVIMLDSLGPEMNDGYVVLLAVGWLYFLFSAVCIARSAENMNRQGSQRR